MSVLATINNIKIPYPTEGVIRTAQLDDTIAPENSVQLAINMNFDRVGAIQTRPGVTSYVDDLVASINNYGTLRNAVIPAGFDFIFQFGTTQEASNAAFAAPFAVKISDTKITVFWAGASSHGYCRNFSIDQALGTVTPLGLPVEFEASAISNNRAALITADVIINTYVGVSNIGRACGFNVSGDTVVVGTAYTYETIGFYQSIAAVDGTHALVVYRVNSGHQFSTILAINTGTLAITEPGSPLDVTQTLNQYNSIVQVDSTHYLVCWDDSNAVKAQVYLVNTGTWAITAVGSALTIATGEHSNVISTLDGTHFINFYRGQSIFLNGQVLAVNLGTFAVTAVGTGLPNTVIAVQDIKVGRYSGTKFVAFYTSNAGTGSVRMISMNASTFDLTFIANTLSGYDITAFNYMALNISSTEVILIWGDVSFETGKAAYFKPYGTVVNGRWLYAGSGTSIFNVPAGSTTWSARRTGLATVSKPRFSQYLNYIWMVNGNEQIGGDPVATSNGGNFGTTLVPENFPQGDFIQAGFEGRVWVANKTIGVIYYTDIVQFIPPSTYVLTFNQAVNFISNLTPQTGQSITALYRVPRALLVFTEDTIYRIYGATSVDAYPAYNVGTFSQESIIETKTGIFFHHSSGFYQFDYGSQPVEISRRIIDFVKAIPRSYYDDISGVWDGFDCVEWNIGPVTVEGVAYTNAYVRYTISTQVWTIYDYAFLTTANIFYDDGTNLNHLVGTSLGKTGALDVGTTDFTQPFYYEFIDRWRGYTEMYYQTKSASGFNVYSENAAGANLSYQKQKSGPNAWLPIGTVTEANNAVMPNSSTEDFDVMRLRLAGNTKGAQVVVHGIEITSLTIKGQEEN